MTQKSRQLTLIGFNSTCWTSSIVVPDSEIDNGNLRWLFRILEFGRKSMVITPVRNTRRCNTPATRRRANWLICWLGRKSFVALAVRKFTFGGVCLGPGGPPRCTVRDGRPWTGWQWRQTVAETQMVRRRAVRHVPEIIEHASLLYPATK